MWIYKILVIAAVVAGPGVAVAAEATFASEHASAMRGHRVAVDEPLVQPTPSRAAAAATVLETGTANKTQMATEAIKVQAVKPFTSAMLKTAVRQWCSGSFKDQPTYGSIEQWDVSQVTDMSFLFCSVSLPLDWGGRGKCYVPAACSPDLRKWNTSRVTSMRGMFIGSEFNSDISTWDTAKVTTMQRMFLRTSFNQDISKWRTANVRDMSSMFMYNANFNKNIGGWVMLT